jgi:hypothetical protein
MIRIIKFKEENVQITKGGKGAVGSSTKAPNGKYVHHRKKSPKKYSKYFTKKTKDGKLLRMGYNISTKKWEVQSVLNPTKEDNSLKEKFLDGIHVDIPEHYFDKYVEFYINPSIKEINDCKKTSGYPFSCRGLINIDGTMIIWRGDLLHDNALRYLTDNPTEWSKKEIKNYNRVSSKPNYILIEIRESNNEICYAGNSYTNEDDIKFDVNVLIKNFTEKNHYLTLSKKYFIDKLSNLNSNIKNESSSIVVHNSPMIGFEDEEKNNLCLYLGHKIIDYFDKYYSEFNKNYVLAVRGDGIELTTNDHFHNSYEWVGNVKTDKQLDGVCSVLINDDIVYSNWNMNNCITAIQKAMNYGKHIYLLTGQIIEYGKDQHNDEVVLKDHHILEVLN